MKCPHCQIEVNEDFDEKFLGEFNTTNSYHSIYYMRCPNNACLKIVIKIGESENTHWHNQKNALLGPVSTKQIYPMGSNRPLAPSEVERKFAEDYNEACFVLAFSPKASAALSRRCLQNIIRFKAGITERNLKMEIEKLTEEKRAPSYICESLETIRGFGNIAAHGMEDKVSGEILDVEPEEAEFLLDVLELMFDFYFVQPSKAGKIKMNLNNKLASAGQKPVE